MAGIPSAICRPAWIKRACNIDECIRADARVRRRAVLVHKNSDVLRRLAKHDLSPPVPRVVRIAIDADDSARLGRGQKRRGGPSATLRPCSSTSSRLQDITA